MASDSLDRRKLIIPTALNVLNLVDENIIDNLRKRQDSDIQLPSLYRLAFMVHYNTGELPVTYGRSENAEEEVTS